MKAAAFVQEGDLFEYHTYTLGRPIALPAGAAKHISLFSREVPAQVRYSLEVGQREGVWATLELDSPSPLPAGSWRILDGDSGELIGQGVSLATSPRDKRSPLPLGRSFDLTAKRIKLEEKDRGWRKEETFQVILTNPKDEGIIIQVVDRFWGDWEVFSRCSLPYGRA